MSSTNLIKVSAIILGCVIVALEVFGLWVNSFLLIITGLVIALLEFMIIETRKTTLEVTDRLYELYMEERDSRVDTKIKDDEIKRLDALTKELKLDVSILKDRVCNIPLNTNAPYIKSTQIPEDYKWQVYCSNAGKLDVQTAEIKSNVGDTLPTITTTGEINRENCSNALEFIQKNRERSERNSKAKQNVGDVKNEELFTPPEYRDTEIPDNIV